MRAWWAPAQRKATKPVHEAVLLRERSVHASGEVRHEASALPGVLLRRSARAFCSGVLLRRSAPGEVRHAAGALPGRLIGGSAPRRRLQPALPAGRLAAASAPALPAGRAHSSSAYMYIYIYASIYIYIYICIKQ